MAQLTWEQVATLARGAGWSGRDLVTAVAIVGGESNRNPRAVGDEHLQTGKWGPSVGLWQVRSLNNQRGTGGTRDELANYDATTNARNAYRVWRDAGRSFRPWTVYTAGTWKSYEAAAEQAVAAIGARGDAATPVGWTDWLTPPSWQFEVDPDTGKLLDRDTGEPAYGGNPLAPLAEVATAARWLTDPDNWRRIALGVGGAALLYVAVVLLSRDLVPNVVGEVAGAAVSGASRG